MLNYMCIYSNVFQFLFPSKAAIHKNTKNEPVLIIFMTTHCEQLLKILLWE
jgi:hypothetical protein